MGTKIVLTSFYCVVYLHIEQQQIISRYFSAFVWQMLHGMFEAHLTLYMRNEKAFYYTVDEWDFFLFDISKHHKKNQDTHIQHAHITTRNNTNIVCIFNAKQQQNIKHKLNLLLFIIPMCVNRAHFQHYMERKMCKYWKKKGDFGIKIKKMKGKRMGMTTNTQNARELKGKQ